MALNLILLDHPRYEGPGAITIVHGAARGGDVMIASEAVEQGMVAELHPIGDADWRRLGDAAGPLRNIAMLDDPEGCDFVLALRRGGETSKGTSQCIREARKRNIPMLIFDYP